MFLFPGLGRPDLRRMLVLAYCAGLRLSELARLDLGDIDLQSGTIIIRETKFFKSRILPLTDSALAALRDYLEARRQARASKRHLMYAPQTVCFDSPACVRLYGK